MRKIMHCREEDLPQIFEEYDKLATEMIEQRSKPDKGFQFLPFHDGSDRRTLCVQSVCPDVVQEPSILQ